MQTLMISCTQSPTVVVLPSSGVLTNGILAEIAETWLASTTKLTLLQEILRENLGERARLRRFVIDSLTGNGTTISFSMFSSPETISYRGIAVGYVPRHRSPFSVVLRSGILAARTVKQLQTYPINHESEYQSL
jgi:hypothetical protein